MLTIPEEQQQQVDYCCYNSDDDLLPLFKDPDADAIILNGNFITSTNTTSITPEPPNNNNNTNNTTMNTTSFATPTTLTLISHQQQHKQQQPLTLRKKVLTHHSTFEPGAVMHTPTYNTHTTTTTTTTMKTPYQTVKMSPGSPPFSSASSKYRLQNSLFLSGSEDETEDELLHKEKSSNIIMKNNSAIGLPPLFKNLTMKCVKSGKGVEVLMKLKAVILHDNWISIPVLSLPFHLLSFSAGISPPMHFSSNATSYSYAPHSDAHASIISSKLNIITRGAGSYAFKIKLWVPFTKSIDNDSIVLNDLPECLATSMTTFLSDTDKSIEIEPAHCILRKRGSKIWNNDDKSDKLDKSFEFRLLPTSALQIQWIPQRSNIMTAQTNEAIWNCRATLAFIDTVSFTARLLYNNRGSVEDLVKNGLEIRVAGVDMMKRMKSLVVSGLGVKDWSLEMVGNSNSNSNSNDTTRPGSSASISQNDIAIDNEVEEFTQDIMQDTEDDATEEDDDLFAICPPAEFVESVATLVNLEEEEMETEAETIPSSEKDTQTLLIPHPPDLLGNEDYAPGTQSCILRIRFLEEFVPKDGFIDLEFAYTLDQDMSTKGRYCMELPRFEARAFQIHTGKVVFNIPDSVCVESVLESSSLSGEIEVPLGAEIGFVVFEKVEEVVGSRDVGTSTEDVSDDLDMIFMPSQPALDRAMKLFSYFWASLVGFNAVVLLVAYWWA